MATQMLMMPVQMVTAHPYMGAVAIGALVFAAMEFMKPSLFYDGDRPKFVDAKVMGVVALIASLAFMHWRGIVVLPLPKFGRPSIGMSMPIVPGVPAVPSLSATMPLSAYTTSMKDLLTPEQFRG